MAYTKILVIHNRLDKCVDYTQNEEKTSLEAAIDYALNREKTERTCYETAVNCDWETVYADMMDTKRRWSKESRVRKGYHVIQSFPPGEVTPEEAHAVGVEFAQRLFGERYEVIVSTHLNKAHLHNHVVVNSVSFVDGRMYRDQFKDYFGGDGMGIRGTSDTICREHGLSVIEPTEPLKSPVSRAELEAARKGKPTVRGLIRQDIDAALAGAYTMKSFWQRLAQMGYTVKRDPNVKRTTVRPAWGKANIRMDGMGVGYTEADILARLAAGRSGEAPAPTTSAPPAPTQWLIPGRHYHIRRGRLNRPRKLKGFRALYFKYLYLLGAVPKRRPNNRAAFLLRGELLKFDRYQEQFRYLMKNRIETAAEFSMQYDALQAAIDALTDRRRDLYGVRRKGDGGETVDGEITAITTRLRGLRRELKLCVRIEGDIPKVRSDVAAQRPAREQDRSNAYEKTHQSRPDRNSKAGFPIPAGEQREH
ncbi:relaxase/mobilization nuclease domain-containing protein [Oscillibacter ruminantium]|uniref:relaxase/mobilization nuclease domain-containing protein n=1 Tax=Oscillibacter ruminantium TaxID=1263547 RepID=UPI003320BE60